MEKSMCVRIKNCVRVALYGMGAMWWRPKRPTDRPTVTDVYMHMRTWWELVAVAERRTCVYDVEYVPRVLCAISAITLFWLLLLERLDGPTAATVVSSRSMCVCIAWSTYNNHATIIHICTTHRHIRFDCVFFTILFFLFGIYDRWIYAEHTDTRACVMCIFESSKRAAVWAWGAYTLYIYKYIWFLWQCLSACVCSEWVSELHTILCLLDIDII